MKKETERRTPGEYRKQEAEDNVPFGAYRRLIEDKGRLSIQRWIFLSMYTKSIVGVSASIVTDSHLTSYLNLKPNHTLTQPNPTHLRYSRTVGDLRGHPPQYLGSPLRLNF